MTDTLVGRERAGQRPAAGSRPDPDTAWRRPVVQFVALGLVALVLLVAVSCLLSRRAAVNEALSDKRSTTQLLATAVVQPALPPGLTGGSDQQRRAAVAEVDGLVRTRLLKPKIGLQRVKIWAPDGTILYSDEPRLIGRRFGLDGEELEILRRGGSHSGLSDLSSPENVYEPRGTQLYEVYARMLTKNGRPLLLETYYTYSRVSDEGWDVVGGFQPIAIGGLLAFELVTVPLVWRLARRLRGLRRERERLLVRAVESSDAERRRIAGDLHDGVVQELAGASFALSAAAGAVREQPAVSASLDRVAAGVRQSMRSLRSLLVEIYPPELHTEGLAAALSDLLAPLPGAGVRTDLQVPDGLELSRRDEALIFRVAQEAVRNTVRHAGATVLSVRLSRDPDRWSLEVQDDGAGFEPAAATGRDGHLGLRLLRDLAQEADGSLEVRSAPARGTLVRLELPA